MQSVRKNTQFQYRHMAITDDGALWGWGDNRNGQIGDTNARYHDTPVHVMDDVIAVSAGRVHTMAITLDGVLWAWGDNRIGQFGDGTTIYSQ